MPNFRAKEINLSSLPCEVDGITFTSATKEQHNVVLVLAKYEQISCLVQVSHKAGFYVCKIEKISKLSDLALMQRILLAFKSAFAKDIINLACAYNATQEPAKNILNNPDDINFLPKPLYIEVGFGSGRHLLARAASMPEANFLGIEIHRPSLLQTSRLASAQNLSNVYLIDADARIVLASLEANSCEGIYVHFPVPWPDAAHRRVISPDFAKLADFCLSKTGFLELRTDEEFYFNYAKDVFANWQLEVRKNHSGFILSKYEARWQRQGKDIYDLIAKRHLSNCGDFHANWLKIEPFIATDLKLGFIKTSSCFAKISRLYELNDAVLAQVHFGSFNAPTSCFLIFKENHPCEFVGRKIINCSANIEGFKLLKELACKKP